MNYSCMYKLGQKNKQTMEIYIQHGAIYIKVKNRVT